MLLLVLFVWVLNLGISIWNAVAVGKAWVETKHAGGWPRFMTWMGAGMSASGFSWCYLILASFVLGAAGKLQAVDIEAGLNLGYIMLIPGILFSGLMITIDSWANAYRKRTVTNIGVAGYNSFAQMYNTYNAVRGIGPAFGKVTEYFKPRSKDSATAFLVILVVVLALGSGIITTWMIVSHVAANDEPMPSTYPA